MSRPAILLASFFSLACSDHRLTYTVKEVPADTGAPVDEEPAPDEVEEDDCEDEGVVLDMDDVSTLQDAFGLPTVRDGLSLEGPDTDAGWRPTTVEVQVMLPAWYFDWYEDENAITVEVYPSATPTGTPWRVTRQVRKADLDWQDIRLPANADWSGDDLDQVGAWMSFDFRDQIPAEALTGPDFFVAVGWDSLGFPNVGYSNFEMPCVANWTDYGDGRWSQNSGNDCSWPMLRISHERTVTEECD